MVLKEKTPPYSQFWTILEKKPHLVTEYITELNDLRIIIFLRKFKVKSARISVSNVNEKLMEHGIYCLPLSYTNGIIDLLP